MITRKILNWTDRKFNELRPDDSLACAKAFGLGAIEGVIDAHVILYPILFLSLVITNKKLYNQ